MSKKTKQVEVIVVSLGVITLSAACGNKVSGRCHGVGVGVGKHTRLDGILHWLSGFQNTKEAIGAFLDCVGDQKSRGQVQTALTACHKEYEVKKSNVAQFFLKAVVPSKLPVELQVLPDWMRMPLSEGNLSSTLIDALVLQRVRLRAQVENFEFPSSHAISRPIRQVLYGLLLSDQKQRDDRKPIVARVNPGECYVEEYDREGLTLTIFWVKAACPVSGKDLHLKTLNEAPRELRLKVLNDTLGVSKLISTPIAAKFQLPVYVTCYWLSKADPQPCLEHLWALLLGFVFGELSDRYKGETGIALVLKRLNNLGSHTTPGGPDLMAAHTYSQWQACMRDTYKLNQLLCLPQAELWPDPELARLYSGPLVHQAAARLRRGATPESFLSGGPMPLQLFRDLERAVLDSLDDDVRDRLQRGLPQNHPTRRAQTRGNLDELARQFDQM
ncbi:protein asteroid homolog 1-like [Alosa alosa]|nr:protein asteroid homolog 1-like [Alosa alosa]